MYAVPAAQAQRAVERPVADAQVLTECDKESYLATANRLTPKGRGQWRTFSGRLLGPLLALSMVTTVAPMATGNTCTEDPSTR